MTQKESKQKVQVWTHDEILSSHQNYQVTQVTMNMANPFVCSRIASKDYFHSRMSRYPNSVSTFHLIRLFVILEQVPLLKTAIVSLALVAFILLRLVHLAVLSILPCCPSCRVVHLAVLSILPSCPSYRLVHLTVLSILPSCPSVLFIHTPIFVLSSAFSLRMRETTPSCSTGNLHNSVVTLAKSTKV